MANLLEGLAQTADVFLGCLGASVSGESESAKQVELAKSIKKTNASVKRRPRHKRLFND